MHARLAHAQFYSIGVTSTCLSVAGKQKQQWQGNLSLSVCLSCCVGPCEISTVSPFLVYLVKICVLACCCSSQDTEPMSQLKSVKPPSSGASSVLPPSSMPPSEAPQTSPLVPSLLSTCASESILLSLPPLVHLLPATASPGPTVTPLLSPPAMPRQPKQPRSLLHRYLPLLLACCHLQHRWFLL